MDVVLDDFHRIFSNLFKMYFFTLKVDKKWMPKMMVCSVLSHDTKKGEALVRVSQVSLRLWGRPLMEIMGTIRRENEDNMPSPSWVDDLGSDYLRFLWLWQSRNNGSALARLGVWNCGNKLEVRDTIWKRNGQGFLWNYLRPSPRYLSQKRKLLFAVIRTLMKILAIFTPNQPPSE